MPVEIEAGSLTSTLSHAHPVMPGVGHMVGPVGALGRHQAVIFVSRQRVAAGSPINRRGLSRGCVMLQPLGTEFSNSGLLCFSTH